MISKLISLFKVEELDYAIDFYLGGTSTALRGGSDIKGALIGLGVHGLHGMERTHYQASENAVRLIIAYLKGYNEIIKLVLLFLLLILTGFKDILNVSNNIDFKKNNMIKT